ncbi:50S ribosomal protein L11 methyltransferase [Bacillus sp. SCS-153A]|uniref:50S ribosomal protein L11 methyltransferase n=1 Tax=Rossellomorea sedimentorum TaxID=3115294 RepID=UPI00390678E0
MLYEFKIKIEHEKVEDLIEKLSGRGLYNFYYEQPIEVITFSNGYEYKEAEEAIEFNIYFEDSDVEHFPADCLQVINELSGIPEDRITYSQTQEELPPQEFEDVELNGQWIIAYSGDPEKRSGKNVLRFEPQAAFGTGLHETTQDCLRIILDHDFTGQNVLDLGTGSGILTIGALLKGADRVTAIDYEPVEREVLYNAGLNGVKDKVQVLQKDLIDGDYRITEVYDWIFINIGGDEAQHILERHELLDKSIRFLVSGLVEWHTDGVVKAFEQKGFYQVNSMQTNEWVTMEYRKK